jgi:hypothetical protein
VASRPEDPDNEDPRESDAVITSATQLINCHGAFVTFN